MSDDIDGMEAGEELDSRIAQQVMGLYVARTIDGELYYMPSAGHSVRKLIPHYSSDIKAAWEVVKRLHGCQINMGRRAIVTLFYGPRMSDSARAEAPTAPLAICIAALRAVRAAKAPAVAGEG